MPYASQLLLKKESRTCLKLTGFEALFTEADPELNYIASQTNFRGRMGDTAPITQAMLNNLAFENGGFNYAVSSLDGLNKLAEDLQREIKTIGDLTRYSRVMRM